jgi:hypothetical protein
MRNYFYFVRNFQYEMAHRKIALYRLHRRLVLFACSLTAYLLGVYKTVKTVAAIALGEVKGDLALVELFDCLDTVLVATALLVISVSPLRAFHRRTESSRLDARRNFGRTQIEIHFRHRAGHHGQISAENSAGRKRARRALLRHRHRARARRGWRLSTTSPKRTMDELERHRKKMKPERRLRN